ncbi:hypothetical protein LG204_02895 [Methylovorus menthalis]|uniref:hypothetical protein n=1 Tax=Methylovorus menthalis TaxID=1002227 RepID=UPI001E532386|nr:hypothetical protein [Methylovorus menthalis]MCB4810261.1 hypothetical protein [Methylovorus menthalis]
MTSLNFKQLDKLFRGDDFPKIENDTRGVRFLKLRSMSRKEAMEEFCNLHNVDIVRIPSKDYFESVFSNESITDAQINQYLNHKYQEERSVRADNQEYLVDQLNRLQNFDWGGSFGNSLEKNIVNNYVKKIQSFDKINDEIEGRLLASMKGYTLNSWYNHWTSIIIEDLFKDHASVLPTVGLVKKIDFFINDIPFDLKVTYFPEQLLVDKLRECGFGNELTKLKQTCRALRIFIPNDLNSKELKLHLLNKLREDQRQGAKSFMKELSDAKKAIIGESEKNPADLKKWFYENQGEARFDASNRFFLVLTDEGDMSASWKLKRNIVFLQEKIHSHLDSLSQDINSLDMEFYWAQDQKTYKCKSDILFLKYDGTA